VNEHPPLAHRAAHLEELLLLDPRVGEQALHVHLDGDALVVRGVATTDARRAAVAVVCAEHLPGVEVRNLVTVLHLDPPAPSSR
jgi:hypothetical protein